MFGLQPPGMSLPLGVYRKCTNCPSLRGWLIVMPKIVGGLGELMGRLEDADTVVLCTKCSKGRISGLTPEFIEKSEPKVIPFWKYLKDEDFVIENMKLEGIEEVDIEGKSMGKGLTPFNFRLSINGEPVARLSRLDLSVWVGDPKPGVDITLTFAIPKLDDEGNIKEIKKEFCHIGSDRIKGLEFDLMKVDDISGEENDEKSGR